MMRRPFVLITIIYILIILLANNFNISRPNLFNEFVGERITVTGVVSKITTTDYGYQTITVNSSSINDLKYRKKVSAMFKSPQEVLYGQAVQIKGTGEALSFKRNPGGLSERIYLGARGYGGKLANPVIKTGDALNRYIYYSNKLTESLSGKYHKWLPEDLAALMDAMILGDSANISDEANEAFKESGLGHIFSISGLNISCISVVIFWILRKMGASYKSSSIIAAFILIYYCLLVGASVSTVRAVFMAIVVMFGHFLGRTPDIYTSLAFTAFVLLIVNPLFLWDTGFLLSFAAVIGIAFLTPKLEVKLGFLNVFKINISGFISATIGATAAVTPIIAYYSGYVSIAGIFASLLIMPFISVLIGAGFLFLFVGGTPLSVVLAPIIYTILKYYMVIAGFFSDLPFLKIITGQPKFYNIMLYYLGIYLLTQIKSPNKRVVYNTALSAAAIGLVLNTFSFIQKDRFETAFLDVKQGDCSILHLPGSINLMIDGGGNMLTEIGKGTGKNVVYPYLNTKGVTYLNGVFLTHPDIDHAAGVIEIMSLVKVGRLFIPDCDFTESAEMSLVLDAAQKEGVPVSKIRAGYRAQLGDTLIECVYPIDRGRPAAMNNSSLVLKITYLNDSILFTGDIEMLDEAKLLETGANIKSNVLKSPHHGSNTSSTPNFVEAVAPEAAIAGTGKNNVFQHPSIETVELYNQKGIKFYNTAEEGAVFIKSAGNGISITTMKEKDE